MTKKLIDVYPYIRSEGNVYFLLFKRSSDVVYANQWRMIGGKVEDGETHWQAGLRELWEETGIRPKLFWTVPMVNTFYEHQTDTIHHIPAFAAELSEDQELLLNKEHQNYKWFLKKEVKNYLSWPMQIQLISCVDEIVSESRILDEWLIDFPQ